MVFYHPSLAIPGWASVGPRDKTVNHVVQVKAEKLGGISLGEWTSHFLLHLPFLAKTKPRQSLQLPGSFNLIIRAQT